MSKTSIQNNLKTDNCIRTFYAVSHFRDWVDIAKKNQKSLVWEPVYWLTGQGMDPLVKQAFPNCVRHSYQEIISFQSPEKYMWFGKNSIDSEILQQYAKYERIALKMMDRLDSGGAFSFEERRMAYYRWLAYSMNVVKELNPQLVINSKLVNTRIIRNNFISSIQFVTSK